MCKLDSPPYATVYCLHISADAPQKLSQENNTTVINSIFRAALAALQRPVAALLPFFAVMHSLRVLALAGEVLLTTGGHRAVITSRELGTCCIQLVSPPMASWHSAVPVVVPTTDGWFAYQLGFTSQPECTACA